MRTRENGAVAPVSHEGLHAYQHRELRNLGMVANEAACNADAVHETENLLEYAMVARTEHRLDGAQKHKMEILLGYALASRNPIYFGAPFGWGGGSYSEHVQGGDGNTASSRMERGGRQGDGQPGKARTRRST